MSSAWTAAFATTRLRRVVRSVRGGRAVRWDVMARHLDEQHRRTSTFRTSHQTGLAGGHRHRCAVKGTRAGQTVLVSERPIPGASDLCDRGFLARCWGLRYVETDDQVASEGSRDLP